MQRSLKYMQDFKKQKFLFDFGMVSKDELFKKLINQGMIQGRSSLAYKLYEPISLFLGHKDDFDCKPFMWMLP